MDTSQQVAVIPRDKQGPVAPVRQRRSIAEKRRIIEVTLAPGASVGRVARAHGVNAGYDTLTNLTNPTGESRSHRDDPSDMQRPEFGSMFPVVCCNRHCSLHRTCLQRLPFLNSAKSRTLTRCSWTGSELDRFAMVIDRAPH